MRRWIRNQVNVDEIVDVRTVNRPTAFQEKDAENQTLEHVSRNIFEALRHHGIMDETILSKLTAYRLVDRVCDIQKGRYIRWIRLNDTEPPRLFIGASAVNVVFTNEGTCIRCKIARFGFVQCRFDKCLVFERLTDEEQLLMAVAAQV